MPASAVRPRHGHRAAGRAAVATHPTGLAAWPDSDLLVATAADGTVTGLSLAKLTPLWTAQLPGGGAVSAPQFDEAGRIVVTTAGGAVVVLDPDDGSLVGLYREPNPVVTVPALDNGTAYYGCADPAAAAAQCDGALHSLVLGGVMALRLGLDADGTVQADRAGSRSSRSTRRRHAAPARRPRQLRGSVDQRAARGARRRGDRSRRDPRYLPHHRHRRVRPEPLVDPDGITALIRRPGAANGSWAGFRDGDLCASCATAAGTIWPSRAPQATAW